MFMHYKYISAGLISFFSVFLLAGCVTNKVTVTARSATEQLLLSTATDHALTNSGLEMFSSRKVFLDSSYFDSYDSKYVVGTIRDCLSRVGALVEDTSSNSDVIIEARSGGLAINQSEIMFGIPSITVPVPLAGPVQTPEVAFYKVEKELTYAKFALLARNRKSTAHVYSSGSLDGKSYDKHFRLLFVSWHRTDVSETQPTAEKARKYQTWFPQYDLTNFTTTNEYVPGTNSINK